MLNVDAIFQNVLLNVILSLDSFTILMYNMNVKPVTVTDDSNSGPKPAKTADFQNIILEISIHPTPFLVIFYEISIHLLTCIAFFLLSLGWFYGHGRH